MVQGGSCSFWSSSPARQLHNGDHENRNARQQLAKAPFFFVIFRAFVFSWLNLRIVLSTASAIVLAAVIGRIGPAAQTSRPAGGPIAIVGARLIDGTGTAPVDDAVVLVQRDRIRAAGARGTVQIPRDAEVVDAKGQVLTPGLVDVHCHINQPPEDMKR